MRAADDMIGVSVRCPGCGAAVTVPGGPGLAIVVRTDPEGLRAGAAKRGRRVGTRRYWRRGLWVMLAFAAFHVLATAVPASDSYGDATHAGFAAVIAVVAMVGLAATSGRD